MRNQNTTNSLPLLHPIFKYSKHHRPIKIPMVYSGNDLSISKAPHSNIPSIKCSVTAIFIPAVVSIQIALFIYYSFLFHTVPSLSRPIPLESIFVFRSDSKHQVWRWWHLLFNVSVELLIGVPLEINIGTLRTSIVYISGVLAGSLVTAIFEHGVSLMGASGGVYALLALHIANVLFSVDHVDCALCWIVVAVFVASCDTAFAIFDHYTAAKFVVKHTAYSTHLVGAIAGFSLGVILLRRTDEKYPHRSVYWVAFAFYALLMLSAIAYNVCAV
ncbi:unnamed protein product [Toxocara canis]|uniref:Rhomboid domain-containing protein n=1 Tax=Toxocara canis TaxID=6265 RepID=A0A183V4Q9_TOXCA|nr:unnamed protein product [Toxocara canis]